MYTEYYYDLLLSTVLTEQIAIEHVEVVFDALELVGMRLVERQRQRVFEAALPRRVARVAEDGGQVRAIANREELALVAHGRPPAHARAPDAAFDRPVVGLVAQDRPQAALPIPTHARLQVPALHLEDSHASTVKPKKQKTKKTQLNIHTSNQVIRFFDTKLVSSLPWRLIGAASAAEMLLELEEVDSGIDAPIAVVPVRPSCLAVIVEVDAIRRLRN